MTDRDQIRWWREATGLDTPSVVPVGVTVEVGRFRFVSTHGVPRGLVRSVLEGRRKGKPRRGPAPVRYATFGPSGSGEASRRQLEERIRNAHERALATGRWAA